MPSKVLPTNPNRAEWSTPVELDGRTYIFTYTFKERIHGGSWYVGLADADGASLITGRRLTSGEDPTAGFVGDEFPPGRFVVIGRDPYHRSDLGGDLLFIYIPAAEVVVDSAAPIYQVS